MTNQVSNILQRGRETVLSALTQSFAVLEDDLLAEQSRHERLFKDKNSKLLERISALEAENVRLRVEHGNVETTRTGEHLPESGSVPYRIFKDLTEKYDRLYRNFNVYREAYGKLKAKSFALNEIVLGWQAYADSKPRRHLPKVDRVEPLSPSLTPIGIVGSPSNVAASDKDDECAQLRDQLRRGDLVTPETPTLPRLMHLDNERNTREEEPRSDDLQERPSSQTTYEEAEVFATAEPFPVAAQTDSQDRPVFVSARSLKRKVSPVSRLSAFAVHEDNNGKARNPENAIRVKEESYSSPPNFGGSLQQLVHYDSIDLDDTIQVMETPRKRQRLTELVGHEPSMRTSKELKEEELVASNGLNLEVEKTSAPKVKVEYVSGIPAIGPALLPLPGNGQDYLDYAPSQNPAGDVLQPISVNRRSLPRGSFYRTKAKSRKRASRGADAMHLLCEDGEDRLRPRQSPQSIGEAKLADAEKATPTTAIKTKPGTHVRLRNLLEAPSHDKHALEAVAPKSPTPNKQARGTANTSPIKRIRRRAEANEIGHVEKLDRSSKEPLRVRPLERLGPDDFKINPRYNQGLDYAFVEVVRSREQRQCFPGCTRPECCGDQFRKVVELGGLAPQRNPGLWSSSQDERDDEQRLLEEYMGRDRATLSRVNDEEREELLLQARTKAFADKHGKHRQAYERRSTPPGFWRTSFPTTQENERDREEARAMERQLVAERYREAMRENGRWLFRDE